MSTQMPKTGLYWHVHHGVLAEYCTSYTERAAYIRRRKPAYEVDTRMRLMRPIQAVPSVLSAAWAKLDKAQTVLVKAQTGEGGLAIYGKAWSVYIRVWRAVQRDLIALHAVECPNCPWDGETIFPETAQ